jgi:hypothetical protein
MAIGRSVLLSSILAGLAGGALADIYKCLDDAGHVTYTNQKSPGKGCSLLAKDQPVSTVATAKPAARPAGATPTSFPRVDGDTQKKRDVERRRIIEEELASEQKSLEAARKDLGELKPAGGGDEKAAQTSAERLQPYKDKVALHERNIESLKKELSNLK